MSSSVQLKSTNQFTLTESYGPTLESLPKEVCLIIFQKMLSEKLEIDDLKSVARVDLTCKNVCQLIKLIEEEESRFFLKGLDESVHLFVPLFSKISSTSQHFLFKIKLKLAFKEYKEASELFQFLNEKTLNYQEKEINALIELRLKHFEKAYKIYIDLIKATDADSASAFQTFPKEKQEIRFRSILGACEAAFKLDKKHEATRLAKLFSAQIMRLDLQVKLTPEQVALLSLFWK